MEKLRTKLVRFLLKRDGLISVPEGWDVEYVKLAGDKVRLGQTLASVITAYNELLEDNLKLENSALAEKEWFKSGWSQGNPFKKNYSEQLNTIRLDNSSL